MTNPVLWLDWVQRLQTIAQAGLTYSTNAFDLERYEDLRQIAAEILAAQTDHDLPHIADLLAGEKGYATPKLDVRGAVFQDDKILLVKERSDGGWTLPGGWIDIGEPPSQAVEREVWEESGYEVRATKLLAVFDRNRHGHPTHLFHIYKLFIACDLLGGEPVKSIETDGADFFTLEALPPLSVARTTAEELAVMFRHYHNPTLPTDFD
ncbi:MAG TPA: NUDIX hydrolase [Anaerolineaceae bacterium]|jgi:ADP-ribose pyrophosphatase YjhB (NUDIX family)|nr:NUDIX hydrolase [Anaerolineaceae bacterium]